MFVLDFILQELSLFAKPMTPIANGDKAPGNGEKGNVTWHFCRRRPRQFTLKSGDRIARVCCLLSLSFFYVSKKKMEQETESFPLNIVCVAAIADPRYEEMFHSLCLCLTPHSLFSFFRNPPTNTTRRCLRRTDTPPTRTNTPPTHTHARQNPLQERKKKGYLRSTTRKHDASSHVSHLAPPPNAASGSEKTSSSKKT